MSRNVLWDKFIDLKEYASIMMEGFCGKAYGTEGWHQNHTNLFFSNEVVDLAHISVIDMRPERGMWMMHIACFSKPQYPMPIYGYDVVVGKGKVTGCFHDMSPTLGYSPAENEFEQFVKHFVPKRSRELPQWAKEIFSRHMVVAGATNNPSEVDQLITMGKENLFTWFKHTVDLKPEIDGEIIAQHAAAQTKYCRNQLQNDNSKNVMVSLGLEEDYVERFKNIQFPY